AEAETVAVLFASDPAASTENWNDPAAVVCQVHWYVRLDCAGMSCAAGAETSVAAPLPESDGVALTPVAPTDPRLFTVTVRVTFCPTVACMRSSAAVACRNAAAATETSFEVAAGRVTGAPLF